MNKATAEALRLISEIMAEVREIISAPLPSAELGASALETDRRQRFAEACERMEELFEIIETRHGEAIGAEVRNGLAPLLEECRGLGGQRH